MDLRMTHCPEISVDEPTEMRHNRYVILRNRAIRSDGGSSSARRTAAVC